MNISLWFENEEYVLHMSEVASDVLEIKLDGRQYNVSVDFINSKEILLNVNGRVFDAVILNETNSYSVYLNGRCYQLEKRSSSRIVEGTASRHLKRNVLTSMPGKIVEILVSQGEAVEEGQPVLILEAMKMQNEIKAPQAGVLTRINPQAGDSVEAGALLFTVE